MLKYLNIIILGPENDHCWLVNKLHSYWVKFKNNPVILVTIIYAIIVLLLTFFF